MFGYYQGMTAKQWLQIEGPMYLFVLLWMAVNVMLFVINFNRYKRDQYIFLRHMVHEGLSLARGAALVLNFNCAIILLPVCRNFVNFFRGQFEGKRSIRRLFDKNILFHKWCAYVICVATAIHIGAHIFNAHNLTRDTSTYESTRDLTAIGVVFATVPGLTGVGITLSLILMVATASAQIRRSYYELFWYTHHLFVVFYVCLCFHGYAGFVEKQINFNQVPVKEGFGQCLDRDSSNNCRTWAELTAMNLWNATMQCLETTHIENVDGTGAFCCPCENALNVVMTEHGHPTSWHWVIGPLCLYILERFYRFFKSQTRQLQVLKVIKHKDSTPVMEIRLKRIPTKAGQYVFLHCPKVSRFEWHALTLTSTPQLEYISLHIRLVGDWTTALADACGFYDESPKKASELPLMAVDGPFGTASEDIFHFPAAVLVGAGIGVTPFASLLQDLFFRKSRPSDYPHFKTRKVYFYWICPGFDAWGWFANLLMDMEEKMEELGISDFFCVRVFMTRGWTSEDAAKIILHENDNGDSIIRDAETGRALKQKMNFGRPQWDKEFNVIGDEFKGENVGVFFCGPKVLSQQLHATCNKMTVACADEGTRFYYSKENF
eukprot:m.35122 g.35122  ORF g.35122 m.35122 type:complete len:604 (-) comp6585_c0_seq2:87-1898(-)